MRTIYFKVKDGYIDGDGAIAAVAEGNINSPRVHVEFEGWEGLSKYATISNSTGEYSVQITLGLDKKVGEETYEFDIPADCCKGQGNMGITFTGYEIEGDVINTATMKKLTNAPTAYVRVLPSDAIFDDKSIDAPAQAQLQAEIDHLEAEYNSLPDKVMEASGYAASASSSATSASTSATNAAQSEANALSYKNKCESIYNNVNGGYVMCGEVTFENLPPLSSVAVGETYVVSDAFTTTSDFREGAGVSYPAGTEVYKIKTNLWETKLADVAQVAADLETLAGTVSSLSDTVSSQGNSISTLSSNKVDKVNGKGLSTNDYTTTEKNKLAGITAGATNVTVDASLSTSSSNAIRNSAVATALNNKNNLLSVVRKSSTTSYHSRQGTSPVVLGGEVVINAAESGWTPIGVAGIQVVCSETIDNVVIVGNAHLIGSAVHVSLLESIGAYVTSFSYSVSVDVIYKKN